MRKLANRGGFSLIEMMVTLVILVCLVIGIGVGMDAGGNIYRVAVFESDSAALSGILNTSLGDILRYSETVEVNSDRLYSYSGDALDYTEVPFVFTSYDYGIQRAYFTTETTTGILQMKNLKNDRVVELINTGSYPDLKIKEFKVKYYPEGTNEAGGTGRGGYFKITYKIVSATDDSMERSVEFVVRMMNT